MKVHGLVLVSARECRPELSWNTPFAGGTLLGRAVATLRSTPNVDAVFVLTDEPGLLAAGPGGELPAARELPGWFFDFKLPFFSKEHWLLSRALSAVAEAGAAADVLLVHDWRCPLVPARTLERLYHALMEDRVASRVTAIYPVDPNLFMVLPGSESFFPVWSDPGQDRQMIPQLFRSLELGAVHPKRLLMPIPETRGQRVPRHEGLLLERPEDMELAEFYLTRPTPAAGA